MKDTINLLYIHVVYISIHIICTLCIHIDNINATNNFLY